MLISEKIGTSETKYKTLLEIFFKKIFDETFLPSHGIDHHRRVWNFAKEILQHLENHGFESDQLLTDNLIIACYLHDSGMSVDAGFNHGLEGRRICERFLSENKLPVFEFSEAVLAIEHHDNKEYAIINRPDNLLTILSVADDLDAFGFAGIYRYLEIYIARNKSMAELGDLIISNCENRFNNFLRTYGFITQFRDKHSGRYEIITSFFQSYNQQVGSYVFDNQNTAGYCGVAEIIAQILKEKKPGFPPILLSHPDPVIQWFFVELKNEMN
jgi:HD superfamily phosphodiesterase